jgi:hypothetical protein
MSLIRASSSMITGSPANVRDYGAVGDGLTDDTAALQAVITAAEARGGGMVLFPPGVYKTTYTLLFGSNLHLYGPGATINYATSQTDGTALVSRSYDGVGTCQHTIIEGLEIKTTSDKGNGIGLPKASDITVRDCWGTQIWHHLVDMAGCSHIVVEDCYRDGGSNTGIQIDNLTATGGLYVENSDHTLTSAVVDSTHSHHIAIRNCTIRNNTAGAIHLHRTGGYDLLIEGNLIEECKYGVLADASTDWSNITIQGNTIRRDSGTTPAAADAGIKLSCRCSTVIITNNIVDRYDYGIVIKQNDSTSPVLTQGHVVANNTIRNCLTRGIAIDYCSGTVSGNQLYNIGYNRTTGSFTSASTKTDTTCLGLSIWACQSLVVTGNVLYTVAGTGIDIRSTSSNISLISNQLYNVAQGIRSDSSTDIQNRIQSNTIIGGTFLFWGIYINACNKTYISDNIIQDVKAIGIGVDSSTTVLVDRNRIVATGGAATYGISIFTCTDVRLSDNVVSGFSTATIGLRTSTATVVGSIGSGYAIDSNCTGVVVEASGSAAPVAGAWAVGSRVIHTAPAAGGNIGWVCTTAGTPGTWKTYGAIAA